MALGGICGSLFGGYALNNLQIDKIFLLFSALPAIQLLSCGLVEESSADSKVISENLSSTGGSHSINGNGFHEDKNSDEKSESKTLLRKRSQKSAKQAPTTASKIQIPESDESLARKWFHSLKNATFTLFRAFRQPMILR